MKHCEKPAITIPVDSIILSSSGSPSAWPPAKPKNGMRQVQRTSVQEGEREGQGPAH